MGMADPWAGGARMTCCGHWLTAEQAWEQATSIATKTDFPANWSVRLKRCPNPYCITTYEERMKARKSA